MIIEIFAYNFRILKDKSNLNAKELGEKLGYNEHIIHHWCEGVAFPTHKALDCICEFFNVKPYELFKSPMGIKL